MCLTNMLKINMELCGLSIGQHEQQINVSRQEHVHGLIGGLESLWGPIKCFKITDFGVQGNPAGWIPGLPYVGL